MEPKIKEGSERIKRGKISLYWSSHRYIKGEDWENFGDALGPFLINRMTGSEICWQSIDARGGKKVFIVIGSILELAGKKHVVWGAGIIKSNSRISRTTILAVRGPISYSRVLASGLRMKKIWGDPALLLPFYFSVPKTKSSKTLIVPHYVDFEIAKEELVESKEFEILNLKTKNVEELITEIAVADFVFSSSLHAIIVAHAYGVPAVWVKFSDNLDGDDIKFSDYFMSVGIRLYKPYLFKKEVQHKKFEKEILLPNLEILNRVQLNLLKSCPFLK